MLLLTLPSLLTALPTCPCGRQWGGRRWGRHPSGGLEVSRASLPPESQRALPVGANGSRSCHRQATPPLSKMQYWSVRAPRSASPALIPVCEVRVQATPRRISFTAKPHFDLPPWVSPWEMKDLRSLLLTLAELLRRWLPLPMTTLLHIPTHTMTSIAALTAKLYLRP